ncbi:MAG TPA: YqaJ viral recombinase family protein [Acetobacteraceae bacterium]|nr:YqaJ viral recombinase family protein [Acetobacteraceae bacterium]
MSLHPMPASREEWLANRMRYVGASETAALWGVQPAYALSHYALWHVKRGLAEPPKVEGKRITWGNRLEEVVALAAAEEEGFEVSKGRYAICDDCPGMAASLDFEITADPKGEFSGPGVLETKNVDWLIHRRSWTDGEPPLHILLQLQQQLACTGWQWGAVASLIGGNELRVYRYAARPALIAQIKARVAAFWSSKMPPPVDGSDSAAHVLRELYPEPTDDALDLSESNEFPEAVQAFLDATAAKKAASEAYDDARNRAAALLEGHKRAWGSGYSLSVSITAAKPDRPAKADEIIKGRAETRRYIARFTDQMESAA